MSIQKVNIVDAGSEKYFLYFVNLSCHQRFRAFDLDEVRNYEAIRHHSFDLVKIQFTPFI